MAGETSGNSMEVSFVVLPLDQAVPPRAVELSLQLPNGMQVTVPRNFDEAALGDCCGLSAWWPRRSHEAVGMGRPGVLDLVHVLGGRYVPTAGYARDGGSSEKFQGALSEMQLYSKALSAKAVAALANNGTLGTDLFMPSLV